MKAEWKEFLQASGAEFEEDHLVSFGNPEQEIQILWSGNTFCDLSNLGLVAVSGTDASNFLQNQLTNDVRLVSDTHCQLTAVCTAKGRVIATFRIFKKEDRYYLSLPKELIPVLIAHLRKYVVISKVTIQDVSEEYVQLGCAGAKIAEELQPIFGVTMPTEPNQACPLSNGWIAKIPGTIPRFEVVSLASDAKTLWQKLDVRCAPIGTDHWRLLDIHAGLPSIHSQTTEAFVPQMANLHLIDGVSFTKGCYPGQEIVARTQYLGKLKRRMYLGHIEGTSKPSPGEEIYASIADANQASGKVVDAQPSSDGGFDLLFVTQIANVESGDLRVKDETGSIIQLRALPYPFEADES
jgi:folate-binding protein YgfZ